MRKNRTNYKFSVTVRDFYNCYLGIDDIETLSAKEIDNRYIVWEDVFGDRFRTFKDIYNFVMKNLDTQGICTVEYDPTYGNYKTTFVVNHVKFIETWEQDPKTCLKEMAEEFILKHVGGNYKSFRYNDFGEFIFEDERFYDQLIDRNNIFNNPLGKTYFVHVTYGNLSIVAEYEEVEGGIIKFYMSPETYKQLYAEYKSSRKRITNESVRIKGTSDKALLEGLVNKYGAKRLANVINEMNNVSNRYKSLNENYFYVKETGAISRDEIENHGWETQLRNINKKSKYDVYASLYCWLPEGERLDEVPEQLQTCPISWESNLFGYETEVGLVPDNVYLMHDGKCVVINGCIRML